MCIENLFIHMNYLLQDEEGRIARRFDRLPMGKQYHSAHFSE
jgi:hypothetical protein